MRKSLSSAD